ncbi:hypothetical protein ODJ79_33515 [Actinoplanes sp. KI2]|uniref:hypothetical protein n=1 Tax=Actinoplanes sp. KI2 TaxID=2983315 RepID=UPI0021D5FD7D|nr:hypothetical protein [Actinoplanes sp. KI2]MCU7728658.1 hypothetical protein [Actinoplanes sp. KI2]
MNRAQALRDARLLGASLLARVDPPLTGVPIPSPSLPFFALPADEAGERVCQAMTLRAPDGVDVFALLDDDWRQIGVLPHTWSSPEGPILVGVHPAAGFVLVVCRHAGDHVLYVVSPILSASRAGLYGGIAVGAAIGLVGPCFAVLAFRALNDPDRTLLGFVAAVLLLGGALLISRDTRQFGVGLLIGGAITGIATAGMCSSMLS